MKVCENASLISLNDIVAGQVPGLPLNMFLSALLCKPTGPTGIGDVHYVDNAHAVQCFLALEAMRRFPRSIVLSYIS